MGFGILKCGLMALGRHSAPSAFWARAPQLLLGGLPVRVVDEYRYLGVTIRSDMSVPHILADRLAKGQRAVAALHHFLSRGDVPLSMRSLVFKVCVLPVFTYAAEVWGMCPAGHGAGRMQTTINRTLRSVVGLGSSAVGVSMAPILRELSIPPIAATVAASRARAYLKAQQLRTYICDLACSPFRSPHSVWTNGTVRWLNRWAKWPGVATNGNAPIKWATDMAPRVLADRVRDTVWERADRAVSAASSMSLYSAAAFPSLLPSAVSLPLDVTYGIPIMIQLRTRAFPTARRLAKAHSLSAEFLHRCPVCSKDVPESIPHMLLECPRWAALRTVLRDSTPALSRIIDGLSSSTEDKVIMLLGGAPPNAADAHVAALVTDFHSIWIDSLPHIARFVLHLSQARKRFLRELGVLPPSRISRMGLRPNG